MQQGDLHHLAGDFAGGDEVGRGVFDSPVVGLDLGIMFFGFAAVMVVLGGIDDGDDEAFGFDLRRCGGIQSCFHDESVLSPLKGLKLFIKSTQRCSAGLSSFAPAALV